MTESPEINGTAMKHFILSLTLAFGSFSAIAAGSLDDVDEELQSADRLIYKKQYVEAILILEDAIKNEPENADAWNLLGFASRKMGKLEESAEAYSNALRIDPDHKDALEYQGELFLMLGDGAAAEGNLAKLHALCPEGCEQLELLMQAIAVQE